MKKLMIVTLISLPFSAAAQNIPDANANGMAAAQEIVALVQIANYWKERAGKAEAALRAAQIKKNEPIPPSQK